MAGLFRFGVTMTNRYEGLSAKEADDLMIGTIGSIMCETLDEARRMTRKDWNNRDTFEWSHVLASVIYYAVENRRRGAP
jgi:hypothetical protein